MADTVNVRRTSSHLDDIILTRSERNIITYTKHVHLCSRAAHTIITIFPSFSIDPSTFCNGSDRELQQVVARLWRTDRRPAYPGVTAAHGNLEGHAFASTSVSRHSIPFNLDYLLSGIASRVS